MSMLEQFQKLDDLIVDHTRPPVSVILRNQLHLLREQVEAYQASSDRQDETLATQLEGIKTLPELTQRVKNLEAENRSLRAEINEPPSTSYIEATYSPHNDE